MGRAPRNLKARVKAKQLLARLDEPEFRKACRLSPEEVERLHQCVVDPPRNAGAVVRAAEALMSYAYSKPKEEHEVSGSITVEIRKYEKDGSK